MANSESPENVRRDLCEDEFGRHGRTIEKFLAARHKRGIKKEEPRKEFNAAVGMIFNHGILTYLRASLWQPLEEARAKKGLRQEDLADELRLVPSTYSKIQLGATNLESIVLLLRPLGLEFRDLVLPPRSEQTAAGLLAVLPVIRYEALGIERPRDKDAATLKREDVEWLLHLDLCGAAWLKVFLRKDEKAGALIAACLASVIGLRLGRPVQPPKFDVLIDLWDKWIIAWEMSMAAVPTGKLV